MSEYSLKKAKTERFLKLKHTILKPEYIQFSHPSSEKSGKQSSTNISETVSPQVKPSKAHKRNVIYKQSVSNSFNNEVMPAILDIGLYLENLITQVQEEKICAFDDLCKGVLETKNQIENIKSEIQIKRIRRGINNKNKQVFEMLLKNSLKMTQKH